MEFYSGCSRSMIPLLTDAIAPIKQIVRFKQAGPLVHPAPRKFQGLLIR